jgi:predicted site-specific integrase-resolvase
MTKSAPEVKPGHIYNKSETAILLGISRVTLRKYTRLRRIEPQFHPLSGAEYYTAESIMNAWNNRIGQRLTDATSVSTAIGRMNLNNQRTSTFNSRLNALKSRIK